MNNINLKGDFFSKMFSTFSDKEKDDIFKELIAKTLSSFFDNAVWGVEDDGCSYDISGRFYVVAEKHELESYKTLSDFLEAYSGESSPTFVSGCGMYYKNYQDKFDDLLQDESYEIAKNMVFDALGTKENEKEDLIQLLFDKYDHEFHDDLVFPIQWKVSKELEKIMKIPFLKAIRTYHENQKNY